MPLRIASRLPRCGLFFAGFAAGGSCACAVAQAAMRAGNNQRAVDMRGIVVLPAARRAPFRPAERSCETPSGVTLDQGVANSRRGPRRLPRKIASILAQELPVVAIDRGEQLGARLDF